ncbi:hypothetical protein BG003_007912 [Podila horticola]|nr:hypothetical protein BG003_007912 [Podila horticola]
MDEVNKKLTLTVKVNIKSPSTLSLKLGDIFFKTSGPDGPIGITTLQNVDLNHGDNPLTAIVVIDLSLAGAAKFVSGLDKADATVTLTGTGSSPANPVTLAAVQSLEINVVIPQTLTVCVVFNAVGLSGDFGATIKEPILIKVIGLNLKDATDFVDRLEIRDDNTSLSA